jgi:predicted enzyme related to lactoylglutathione lyase
MNARMHRKMRRGRGTVNLFAATTRRPGSGTPSSSAWSHTSSERATPSSGSATTQGELGIIDSKHVPGIQSHGGRAGVVVYWHVDDVDVVLAKAVGMGDTQLEAPEDRSHGFITATAVDPFGNLLGLMYNPHYLEILSSLKPA